MIFRPKAKVDRLAGSTAKPLTAKSERTYVLYEKFSGAPTSHWRDRNGPTARGVLRSERYPDDLSKPEFRWVVRARSADEAYYLAANSGTTSATGASIGVWWDRREEDPVAPNPPPLGNETTQRWAMIATCGGVRNISFHESRDAAEVARDSWQCSGRCERAWGIPAHVVRLMTLDEATVLEPEVWTDALSREGFRTA